MLQELLAEEHRRPIVVSVNHLRIVELQQRYSELGGNVTRVIWISYSSLRAREQLLGRNGPIYVDSALTRERDFWRTVEQVAGISSKNPPTPTPTPKQRRRNA